MVENGGAVVQEQLAVFLKMGRRDGGVFFSFIVASARADGQKQCGYFGNLCDFQAENAEVASSASLATSARIARKPNP